MDALKFIDDAELRGKLTRRVEILDKVKGLFSRPDDSRMTMQQVADFYEVNFEAIKSCYRHNKEDFERDGTVKMSAKEILSQLYPDATVVNYRTYKDIQLSDDVTLRVPNSGIILFPRRSVLRFGTLLNDSIVAQEVRTQMLNTAKRVSERKRTGDIDEETRIINDMSAAFAAGDTAEMMAACENLQNFQNRHIDGNGAECRAG